MARPRPEPQRRSPLRSAARMALNYALLFALAAVAVWGGSKLLHRPSGSAGVTTPAQMTRGNAPGPLTSGGYRLTLQGLHWVRQDALPAGLKLDYRARPNALVDYLVLDVGLDNVSARSLPLRYAGSAQDVRFVVTSTDPDPFHAEPVPAGEAAAIAGQTVLGNGPLAAGASRKGVLVFAVEPYRKRLTLLLVPDYPTGTRPDQGPAFPALELRLNAAR